jgi:hypothetical protein
LIYQCYFRSDQRSRLFRTECYEGFGLEPDVNDRLTLNCPELASSETRLALTEYACLLWFWRNRDEIGDDWFGTTSYRQLEKVPFIASGQDELYSLCDKDAVNTWGYVILRDSKNYPLPISLQTEMHHPGMTSYLTHIFQKFNRRFPDAWFNLTEVVFANYWLLSNPLFFDFMEYSWPLVSDALNCQDHFYFRQDMRFGAEKKKAVGYFIERLFILWCIDRRLPLNAVDEKRVFVAPTSIYA